jgi:arylformamidase
MGVYTSGHEVRDPGGGPAAGQPNHTCLLGAGLPLVEYLANLGGLLGRRFFTCILPLKLAGAEACPVRVIAIEWAPGE